LSWAERVRHKSHLSDGVFLTELLTIGQRQEDRLLKRQEALELKTFESADRTEAESDDSRGGGANSRGAPLSHYTANSGAEQIRIETPFY